MFRRHPLIPGLGVLIFIFMISGYCRAAPAVSLPAGQYEFATVPSGIVVTHDMVVKNTGDAPLKIKGIRGQ